MGVAGHALEHRGDCLGERLLTLEALVESLADLGDGVLEGIEARGDVGAEPPGATPVNEEMRSARSRSMSDVRRCSDRSVMALASDRATSTCSWAIWAYVASEVNWLLICDSHLLHPVLQFLHFHDGLGRGLVAEEAVDRVGVEGVGVVDVRGVLPNMVRSFSGVSRAPPGWGACTYIGVIRLVLELLLTSC